MSLPEAKRITPTAHWTEKHRLHLAGAEAFPREPFNHPDGTWLWLVCPCGHKHLTTLATLGEKEGR